MYTRLIFVLCALFVLVGCGGRSDDAPPAPAYSPAPTPEAASNETDAVAADTVAYDSQTEEYEPMPFSLAYFSDAEIGRFPEWLRVGLTLYDATDGEAPDRPLPDDTAGFGDAWFVPDFLPPERLFYAPAVAYAFVRYISSHGALYHFARAHSSTAPDAAALIAAMDYWESFTGEAANAGFAVRYERRRARHIAGTWRANYFILLSVRGQYATYFFGRPYDFNGTPGMWTPDMVQHHVAIGEESFRFVADWLGYDLRRPFSVYNIQIENPQGGGGYGNRILINFQHIQEPPWAMAHEAVHALLASAGIRNNFPRVNQPLPGMPGSFMIIPYFEEGLCIMLELFFEIYTANERFALEAAGRRRRPWAHHDDFIDPGTRLTLKCALNYVNFWALLDLDLFYDPTNTNRFGTQYTTLNFHHTAASFMFYLYTERGTRDDLLRAYQNINLMYEIYGANMAGMIASWRVWLDGWR